MNNTIARLAGSRVNLSDSMKSLRMYGVFLLLFLGIACSTQRASGPYKDDVEKALEQADLKGVTIDEDRDKNLVTLGGTLHSEEAKAKAGDVAKAAAGNRIIANEIGIQPVGLESEAKSIASNLDDGIESNFKAALTSNSLDKQHIRIDVKNGVLTLKGTVEIPEQREQAQQVAANVPNVQQVVNEIEVRR